ncbi:dynein axonemal heavy chain 6 [Athalia rosae]|uniref:dynein axonemal heavy chain 6 n=1 Tax=Athalia rosae TaxID=37344 RepID=UPI002033A869|nr:dynein axonemal heavy chain 6 [Athalia rosae]
MMATEIFRGRGEIPFHVPHKKLLEKIVHKKEIPEPLTGFTDHQDAIRQKVCLPYIPLPHVEEKSSHRGSLTSKTVLEDSEILETKTAQTPPLEIVDQLKIIEDLRNDPKIGFFYMVYAVERCSQFFTPYAMKIVPYDQLQRTYMTISTDGVTQYSPEEMSFTPIELWEREYRFYLKLMKIRSFVTYRLWKAFYVWRKTLAWSKFVNARNYMEKNLFISDPILSKALLEVKAMCAVFLDSSFNDFSLNEKQPLFMYAEAQLAKLESIRKKLDEFRKLAVDIVNNACLGALLEQGYTPDDSNITIEQTAYGKLGQFSGAKFKMPKDGVLKMSFIEQASKRKKCYRLSCFIHLIDYMQTNMMHVLLNNTYKELLKILRKHTEFLPSKELLEATDIGVTIDVPRTPGIYPQHPFFVTNLIIAEDTGLVMDPSEEILFYVFQTICDLWEENLNAIKPLLSDQYFSSFTRPLINHKIEDKLCGNPPEILTVLKQDAEMDMLKNELRSVLNENIDAVKLYWNRLIPIEVFYKEDMASDDQIIRRETVCEKFRKLYIRYSSEIETINEVADHEDLGIFLIILDRFKDIALVAPNKKLRVLESVLPSIGKSKVDTVLTAAIDAINYLEIDPVSTEDFVAYIKFLDKAQHKIDSMETQLEYAKEIYDIMEEYQIPVPPEEVANYLGINVQFTSLRLAVEKRVVSRDNLIASFNSQLQLDIDELIDKISDINDEVVQSWLLSSESNIAHCFSTLKNLNARMTECASTANEYRNYQKAFKVEVTRFDILEQVTNEVRLRTLLWETVDGWASAVEEWYSVLFESLNVEEMTTFTSRNVKNIVMLEKGLPANDIVPKLKNDVETIRDKLPIIGYLRNPNLKSRHWQKIESLLNYKFTADEPVTLGLLENLNVFSYPAQLMEIAAAASSEFGLELLLKKVEDSWKTLEFTVIPHKESKDVFILGTLEDVQAVLEESNINVQTIAASRHVGPIKSRIDDWVRQLDLFWKTLDAWQYCQQQWLYLESIFSAPDIQRQLPVESKLFIVVDKSWKEIMRKTVKMPLALEACCQPGLYEKFIENNKNLDQILKCLEAYLETKRIAFPRFFFLSNDELLEILAQTRNPHAVQRHLQKCFDAIHRLEFATAQTDDSTEAAPDAVVLTTDISAMLSPEGERVQLGKGLKARGNVEDWLGKVEASMFSSLKRRMKSAISDLRNRGREMFLVAHPSQIVLTVSQIFWARNVHIILDDKVNVQNAMRSFEQKCYTDLNQLAAMVRGELTRLVREVIINLITVDVHARDTITILVENKVSSSTNFEWMKALRYYWDEEIDNCLARMSSAEYLYGYEYLGAQRRLVITPLTDKCYLCLMGALQLDLGGAPAGPAGTGKTETTKDLAKALAIQCVVFNCSEGLDYRMMGRFFSGLATSGAWCCFDEFNRIDIEVLSVIAQQLITIRNAKVSRAKEFVFEGRKIKLVMSCAAFITMNPGYAGRTELPDNLKSLFRPISMMVPDYKLIAEVTLYSEGFESSKSLSKKMTLMYTLCSEQLSQQDHYDFGMRAVKSVLVMAGSLKRENPDKQEDVVLIRALRDSNIPKFLADDTELFQGILGDLFPGVIIPEEDYGVFQKTTVKVMREAQLQPELCSIKKVIQLHETMIVRHGVMLVGPTGGGKTTVLKTLCDTLTRLHREGIAGQYFQPVHMYVLNPKSVTIGELYGEINPLSNEWHDGLLGIIVRNACSASTEDHQWVVCDGPVDAVWIENMNTVLDDNKMLCLANSERIKFTPYVHMVFEVMDLAQASPATVSRCGMVYLDPTELQWLPYVKTWASKLPWKLVNDDVKEQIIDLFERYMDNGLTFFKKNCDHAINQVDISKANMLCALMESILNEPGAIDRSVEKSRAKTFLTQAFIFAFIWSVGGNLIDSSREIFETFVKELFDENSDARLPSSGDLWSLYLNVQGRRMDLWLKLLPTFNYNPEQPFFEILVPTVDTVRFSYIMQKLVEVNKAVLFTGGTGVGKSVIAKLVLNNLQKTEAWVPVILNFSAQTSSGRTQEILELKLEKKKKALIGAPVGKRVCVFIDDVNMPKLDTYGSQPPIELLRQFLDFGGLYDRDRLFWKVIEDVVLSCACAPPGGGRNVLTPRFVRHFGMLVIPAPTEGSLKAIFRAIMRGFLKDFVAPVVDVGDKIVGATVEIYDRIAIDLLPTPEKSHYVFNLRDLSKCFQGMLQADPSDVRESKQILRLFYHECLRVFHDRLINVEDKSYFYRLLTEMCKRTFGNEVVPLPNDEVIEHPPILLFGDFMVLGAAKENRIYQEINDVAKLKGVLQDYLDDYCLSTVKEMNIIFFMDAVEHLCRLARILRSERGNGLLVGVGGMGKQSLTKLASHVNGYPCQQIEVCRGYDVNSWHDDLRRFYFAPGSAATDVTFLFTDTQIVVEEFLEDINNTLNSGEVPNLFETDELEKAIIATRPAAKLAGIPETARDDIYRYFIGRVRNHLHLMLCMSPVGDAFRRRCRMFPSLVNCCTIDWYTKWPDEALLSVAENTLGSIVGNDSPMIPALSSICVLMHESVEEMTVRFFNEVRRRYYTTPSSYLELLKLYASTLEAKKKKTLMTKDKISNGLRKLFETNETVADMKAQLLVLAPKLKVSSEEVSKLLVIVQRQQVEADKARTIVAADEATAKVKAEATALLEADAKKDLDAAMPALEEAKRALESLNKNDINEIKVFNKPPHLVRFVMEAVDLLLGEKLDWASAKIVLADVHFLDRLLQYPKDDISDKLLKKLQEYVNHPEFLPEIVAKQSKVCKSICIWVRAIHGYAKLYRIVEPKRIKLVQAQNELWVIEGVLQQKQKQLAEVEKKIAKLQAQFDGAVNNLAQLEYNMQLAEARLNRSGRLTSALSDEQVRWEELMKDFDRQIQNLTGDILIAAGALAYLGAFTSDYREELLNSWIKSCTELEVPITPGFNLINVLADPYEIRCWNGFGLPRDQVSTENAILVTQAGRWPLMIDPQEQANRWIRNMERENNLKICKMTDSNFMRIMEACIRIGAPMLLQEIGETLDPSLEPVLLKQVFIMGGRLLIRIGDSEVEYDSNFKLYITTKMANPHYLPEICIKVTIVNFTVTPSGLEDQLLADVVRLERPDLEKMRNELIAKINADKGQLSLIEDKILSLLFSSGDNILDNEELIETLNDSKETSAIIATRLVETEATEEKITIAREKYRSVATRGSVLYFVVANLAEIDPMYQFSLKYFNQVFNIVIETSRKSSDLKERLLILYNEITTAIYTNVSRGLFEKHKLVFSFMLNVAIYLNSGIISPAEWNFLLHGPMKPDYPTLTEQTWNGVIYLTENFETFKKLAEDALNKINISIGTNEQEINIIPTNNTNSTYNWNANLTDMEKLMLLKAMKEEKLIFGITAYVQKNLGQQFIESPMISLQLLFPDTSKTTPLVFVLSTGSDPFGAFQKFAGEMGFVDRIQSISLGQGQGPVAESLLKKGTKDGDWVFLQNCHLATSWMLTMEKLVIDISEAPEEVHQDFRLFLSSMPSISFPISILQNSVKVTNEPPKGLKANIKRSLFELDEDFFENHALGIAWRKMVFGICFFHAIIQERKKFGPLGWNILYEFNTNDRECCLLNLQMFCTSGVIPWDALIYITGEITYGGRITDNWDLRCLKTILEGFFSPETLNADYTYSLSGTYYCPVFKKLQEYRDFVENFPIIEEPEIYGMHENANIAYQLKETKTVINTLMEVQPRVAATGEGVSSSEIAFQLADNIMERIILSIDPYECNPNHLKKDSAGRIPSLTTVLLHEVDRFNKLLAKIHSSMDNLQRAIRGFVVMSDELEKVFRALIHNQVPQMWHNVNVYPSLKSLGSWIRDLELRIDFISTWLLYEMPISFWISGMSFPQGFITGMLQTYARKHNTPIDHLKLDFTPTKVVLAQDSIETAHREAHKEVPGAYGNLSVPQDGVLIHGLFLDAGKWDFQFMVLVDANKGEMNPSLPVLHVQPTASLPEVDPRYVCPLYKTSVRAGVLSTTGHSTNFVVAILLSSARQQSYWILKGTALLIQITD